MNYKKNLHGQAKKIIISDLPEERNFADVLNAADQCS